MTLTFRGTVTEHSGLCLYHCFPKNAPGDIYYLIRSYELTPQQQAILSNSCGRVLSFAYMPDSLSELNSPFITIRGEIIIENE